MNEEGTTRQSAGGESGEHPTIFTHKARCRDCYRCLRVCPVKAIRLQEEQATVVPELCVGCGRCIRECPQGAKTFRRDTEKVRRWIAAGEKVAASVAPSFAGLLSDWERRRFASALRRLGFHLVEETAVGAWKVADETVREAGSAPGPDEKESELEDTTGQASSGAPVICSACPAVVRFVELYRPAQAHMLATPVSPMLAHGRMLKGEGKVDRVVFIGPCVAKKDEAGDAHDKPVDAVLTFVELQEWMREARVDLAQLEESSFDREPAEASAARLFALEGGLARTAGIETDLLADKLLAISGIDDLEAALEGLRVDPEPMVLEPLLCTGGCINGPAVPAGSPSLLERRRRLLSWARSAPAARTNAPSDVGPLSLARRAGKAAPIALDKEPSDEDIRRVLAEVGKAKPEDRLDCGACGYDTCRDKAVAVLRGMAEREMCIPMMRRLAEQRTDRVIETSPNGIVILDERLRILHTNPAFRRFFVCSDAVLGKPISYLMDPAPFERVHESPKEKVELTAHHEPYQLICRQLIYSLPEERQLVGIFVNLTAAQANEQRLQELRSQTLEQARELLEHQIGMAQKMAMFLGESTARGEDLVHNLLQLAGADDPGEDPVAAAAAGAAAAARGTGRGGRGSGEGGGRGPGGSGGRLI